MRFKIISAIFTPLLAAAAAVPGLAGAPGGVVIDEIFYRSPSETEDLQWIELLNAGEGPADLGGWTIEPGPLIRFPAGASLEPGGYLVIASDPARFRKVHGANALGPLSRRLKRKGERLRLLDSSGAAVDSALYGSGEGWPESADGGSASLERICPAAPGDLRENWAASPLPADAPRPAGTPGKPNSCRSDVLPPVIALAGTLPDDLETGGALRIEAEVKDGREVREVRLLYRVVERGVEGEETALPMARTAAGKFAAELPGATAGTLLRYRVEAVNAAGARRLLPAENDLRPTFSAYVHDPWHLARIPFGFIIHSSRKRAGPSRESPPRGQLRFGPFFGRNAAAQPELPARGTSAFVHVDETTGKTTVFDHLQIPARPGERGFKVHFHRDRPFRGMSVASIVYEGNERFLLQEALAYDVYRRAGNAAPLADFIRLSVDGRLAGYHLLIEQPNRSFLRRHGVRTGGNLYKLVWFGGGLVGQHRKKTNRSSGHEDLVAVVERLSSTSGEEQWKAIEESFDVRQVATYFAVNTVLSHWDGFFNNYYTYHDIGGTGKWQMYPWDQDKTWGYHDGVGDGVFFDMPLTYGMTGDRPPGGRGGGFGFFGGGTAWWRPPGHFSGPLLANPSFRKVFLGRTREILETVYTPAVYFPLIESLAARLDEDVRLRARMNREDPEEGVRRLAGNLELLRLHLTKRREFLLAQKELRGAGAGLPPPGGPGR